MYRVKTACINVYATCAEPNFIHKLRSPSRCHVPLTYNRESTVPESRKSGVFVWYLRPLVLQAWLLHFCLIFGTFFNLSSKLVEVLHLPLPLRLLQFGDRDCVEGQFGILKYNSYNFHLLYFLVSKHYTSRFGFTVTNLYSPIY
jgi:hypothetical protein